jgi:hypothetical protein
MSRRNLAKLVREKAPATARRSDLDQEFCEQHANLAQLAALRFSTEEVERTVDRLQVPEADPYLVRPLGGRHP